MTERKNLPFDLEDDNAIATWANNHDLSEIEDHLIDVDPSDLGLPRKAKIKRVSEAELETLKAKSESSIDLRVFALRLPARDVEEIRHMAEETGVGPTTMARILIKEAMKARHHA